MISLEAALARLGAQELSAVLGAPVIALLQGLDFRHLAPSRLAELVSRQLGPQGILLSAPIRRQVLEALPKDEAEALARLLGVDPKPDPWKALQVSYKRGQTSTQILFSFFGCLGALLGPEEEGHHPSTVVKAHYPLFGYQRRAANAALAYLTSARLRRVLLHMPTGAGKTRTAMQVIADFFRRMDQEEGVVLWLAHTEELCEQAAEEFERAWQAVGNRDAVVFRNFGPYRVDLDQVRGGFLVGGLSLLYRESLTRQSAFLSLARRTPLVIMDEAHQAVAPTYNHLLSLLAPDPRTAILGLSATPGRSLLDAAEDMKLATFFGRQKVTLQVEGYVNPVEFLQQEGYLAQVEYVPLPYDPKLTLTDKEREELRMGLDLPTSAIDGLARDLQRNLLVLTRTMQEADRGGKILLFACSVEHAYLLAHLLRMKRYASETVTSLTRADRRRDIIARYRDTDDIQILTNYGVLTMGFDAPRTNTAVIARPTRSVVLYSQMVGRAARGPRAGGNSSCRILTVVDRIPGFRSIAEAFVHWEDIWTDVP